jgi:hypothetical protein
MEVITKNEIRLAKDGQEKRIEGRLWEVSFVLKKF